MVASLMAALALAASPQDVTPLTPPALEGTPRVGETVRARAGTWRGGIGDDLRIEACRDLAAKQCETLAAPIWEYETPRDGSVVIGAQYAGWYLRVADRRERRYDVRPTVIYERAADVPTLSADPLVAFSPFAGPVAAVAAPYVPLVPTVAFYRTARRERAGIVLGRVSCPARCLVSLTVRDGRRTFRRTRTGSGPLVLAARPRKGTLRVRVAVDGGVPATARVRLR